MPDTSPPVTWRKSSRSNFNGNCVEVGAGGARVGVRDSTDPAGPALSFPPGVWDAFLGSLRGAEGEQR
jgi:hypothetical protein